MARPRAKWRTRADDPRSGLGWLLQDWDGPVRYLAKVFGWSVRIFAIDFLASGNFIGGLIWLTLSFLPNEVANWTIRHGHRALPRRVRKLLTLLPPSTLFPCLVEVRSRGVLVGRDVGIVTFLAGWLHFEGVNTAFSLSRAEVDRWEENRIRLSEGGQVQLIPNDRWSADGVAEENLIRRFRSNLASWMRSDAVSGDSILPPTSIHRSGAMRGWSDFVTAAVSLIVVPSVLSLAVSDRALWLLMSSPSLIGFAWTLWNLRRVARRVRGYTPIT